MISAALWLLRVPLRLLRCALDIPSPCLMVLALVSRPPSRWKWIARWEWAVASKHAPGWFLACHAARGGR